MMTWLIGGSICVLLGMIPPLLMSRMQRRSHAPLVEPAPDAFPLHYRSPYVEPSGPRLVPIPGTDKYAYGYQPLLPEPRLDRGLIGHGNGKTLADCSCRSCRKWRSQLYRDGDITEQEAYPERVIPAVKQERAHTMTMECEVSYE